MPGLTWGDAGYLETREGPRPHWGAQGRLSLPGLCSMQGGGVERGLGRKQEKVRDSHMCAKCWEKRSELEVCRRGS